MARTPNVTCNLCGKQSYRAPRAQTDTEYRCHPCRRVEPQRPKSRRAAKCYECGADFVSVPKRGAWTVCCSKRCGQQRRMRLNPPPRWGEGKARAIPTEWTERTRRKFREAVTPGLSIRQRRAMLARWMNTGAPCAYCAEPATTVDHIIPLSRGGTNYEGNLAPCCRSCNSSKCDLLLVEWRLGRAHGLTYTDRPWMQVRSQARRTRPAAARPELSLVLDSSCAVCAQVFTPKSVKHVTCSPTCSREWTGLLARNAYRRKVGLPEDWVTPAGRLFKAS